MDSNSQPQNLLSDDQPETMILQLDKEILELVSDDFTEEELKDKVYLSGLIEKMTNTMIANRAVGLAAVQVGIPKNLFVTVNPLLPVAINSKITYKSSIKTKKQEGCLSLGPGVFTKKLRSDFIRCSFLDKNLVLHEEENFNGFLARIIQHEVDHVNGKLI